jgi:hypothetical protein
MKDFWDWAKLLGLIAFVLFVVFAWLNNEYSNDIPPSWGS